MIENLEKILVFDELNKPAWHLKIPLKKRHTKIQLYAETKRHRVSSTSGTSSTAPTIPKRKRKNSRARSTQNDRNALPSFQESQPIAVQSLPEVQSSGRQLVSLAACRSASPSFLPPSLLDSRAPAASPPLLAVAGFKNFEPFLRALSTPAPSPSTLLLLLATDRDVCGQPQSAASHRPDSSSFPSSPPPPSSRSRWSSEPPTQNSTSVLSCQQGYSVTVRRRGPEIALSPAPRAAARIAA